ncbi:MAG TPA: 3-oxoadipate enol-lactonase [Roseiarcus sp.]|nr:3-oxoadipate enol-lactonase [Roseiarcus sp.]
MSFARVNGGVVHFSDEGLRHAPVLVFVNALGSDFRIWDDVARILSRQFRLIRYDKRGHGLSEAGPDRYDMADYARDLSALLDRLGVARATVVGVSMGGVIVQELYRQRPSIFSALVLSDTAAKIGSDESWDARIAEVERGGIEAIADPILERWFTADFRARRSEDLVGWRVMLTRTPTQGYLAACGALKRADLRPYAGAIEVPTLCIVGEEDGSTPVELVRETAELIKGCEFEVIKGAGHLPNLEQPDTHARLIARHAERASEKRAAID